MDRERLKEVRGGDLTESRVNQDFLDWLKNKGPTWLLVVLVAVTAYMAIIRWNQHRVQKREQAWAALIDASLPESKQDVASEYPGIFAVPQLALETGAAQLLRSVQLGKALDSPTADPATPAPPPATLSPEDREHYLTRADTMFKRVIEGEDGKGGDDKTLGYALHAIQAYFGRAAIAESRGDVDQARQLYEQAATRAAGQYDHLADVARQRAQSLAQFPATVSLPAAATLPPPPAATAFRPASVDPALRGLLLPPQTLDD